MTNEPQDEDESDDTVHKQIPDPIHSGEINTPVFIDDSRFPLFFRLMSVFFRDLSFHGRWRGTNNLFDRQVDPELKRAFSGQFRAWLLASDLSHANTLADDLMVQIAKMREQSTRDPFLVHILDLTKALLSGIHGIPDQADSDEVKSPMVEEGPRKDEYCVLTTRSTYIQGTVGRESQTHTRTYSISGPFCDRDAADYAAASALRTDRSTSSVVVSLDRLVQLKFHNSTPSDMVKEINAFLSCVGIAMG